MPSDTFRMQMIIIILDLCGQHLNTGSKKERLYEFLHFLQIYILSKQYLPLDVENRVTTCLENLYEASNYHVYTDFTEALKDAKKYKGLNFELDDEELNSQEKKPEHKFDPNDFRRNLNRMTQSNGDSDFTRKKENREGDINIDDEIQKIISESLIKAKGTSKTNMIINPLSDMKKTKLKENSTKMRLITKQANTNKVVVKEIDKEVFLQHEKQDSSD